MSYYNKKSKFFAIIFAMAFFMGSCVTKEKTYRAYYSVDVPSNEVEIILNDPLQDFLANNKNPNFVLRTTGHSSSVTGEDRAAAELYYTTIEKTLIENGYTVRDRALLNQLLEQNKSYQQIAKKIDTDLIVEIQNIRIISKDDYYSSIRFNIPERGYSGYISDEDIKEYYTQIEFKITLVESGEYGGYMKLNAAPDQQYLYVTVEEKKGEIQGGFSGTTEYSDLNDTDNTIEEQAIEKTFEKLTLLMLKNLGLKDENSDSFSEEEPEEQKEILIGK